MVKKALPKNVKKHLFDLHLLNEANPRQQKALLETSSAGVIRALCQCCEHALKGGVPLAGGQYHKLKRHRHKVRQLAAKGEGVEVKRRLLLTRQKGGFLPFLAPLLAPLLGPVIGGFVKAIGG
jgi:hypothetical protein